MKSACGNEIDGNYIMKVNRIQLNSMLNDFANAKHIKSIQFACISSSQSLTQQLNSHGHKI